MWFTTNFTTCISPHGDYLQVSGRSTPRGTRRARPGRRAQRALPSSTPATPRMWCLAPARPTPRSWWASSCATRAFFPPGCLLTPPTSAHVCCSDSCLVYCFCVAPSLQACSFCRSHVDWRAPVWLGVRFGHACLEISPARFASHVRVAPHVHLLFSALAGPAWPGPAGTAVGILSDLSSSLPTHIYARTTTAAKCPVSAIDHGDGTCGCLSNQYSTLSFTLNIGWTGGCVGKSKSLSHAC